MLFRSTAAIGDISAQSKKLNGTLGGLKQTMLGVFGGNLITQGVVSMQNMFQSASHEFQSTQQSVTRLTTAFANMGITSKQQQKSILEYWTAVIKNIFPWNK